MLTVDSGGVLVREHPSEATVSTNGFNTTTLQGKGFTLTLNLGWPIQLCSRKGDLSVKQTAKSTP